MLEKLKAFWEKFKGYIGVAVGALILLLTVLIKRGADTGDGGKLRAEETNIRENTETKIDLGKQKIEQDEREALWRAEKDKEKKLQDAAAAAKKETDRLTKLEEADRDKFKQEMERQLGVKEKGKP